MKETLGLLVISVLCVGLARAGNNGGKEFTPMPAGGGAFVTLTDEG